MSTPPPWHTAAHQAQLIYEDDIASAQRLPGALRDARVSGAQRALSKWQLRRKVSQLSALTIDGCPNFDPIAIGTSLSNHWSAVFSHKESDPLAAARFSSTS